MSSWGFTDWLMAILIALAAALVFTHPAFKWLLGMLVAGEAGRRKYKKERSRNIDGDKEGRGKGLKDSIDKLLFVFLIVTMPANAFASVCFEDQKAQKIRDKLATLEWICSRENLPEDIATECDTREAASWRAKAKDFKKCKQELNECEFERSTCRARGDTKKGRIKLERTKKTYAHVINAIMGTALIAETIILFTNGQ